MALKSRVGKKKPVMKTRGKRTKRSKDQVKAVKKEEEKETEVEVTNYVCLTPKGWEYRIPKLETCPPAPTKMRLGRSIDGCSLRRPEGFFDQPDIEMFFMFAGNWSTCS